eukprot:gnl/Spiro4/4690_TR2340_c0_g1_i1.p1 gnl/Spiro4/4690_TR2340_c0_g1~~gnl/Spiro4/4690_TR2340_c0_g1_i1.p1  ORF type:complete len:385 (-),score=62.32 gnl/Spiro4/4690_TR2340_c0_g1_i1:77-1159(-)
MGLDGSPPPPTIFSSLLSPPTRRVSFPTTLFLVLLAVVFSPSMHASATTTTSFVSAGSLSLCPGAGRPMCDHKEICQLTIVHAVMKSAKNLDGWNNTLISDTCRTSTTTTHCFDECVQMGCQGEALARIAVNQCLGNESYSVRDCARDTCKRCGYDQTIEQEVQGCKDARRRRMDEAERRMQAEEQGLLYRDTAADNARTDIRSKLEVRPAKVRMDYPTTATSIAQPRHSHLFRRYVRPIELNSFMRSQVADKWEVSPEAPPVKLPPPMSMPAVFPPLKPQPHLPFEQLRLHEGNPQGPRGGFVQERLLPIVQNRRRPSYSRPPMGNVGPLAPARAKLPPTPGLPPPSLSSGEGESEAAK